MSDFNVQEPISVANFIIDYGKKINKPVSNLQLQKIMYFVQGAFLEKYNQPIIDGQFSRWQYGPVLREIYTIFKYNGPSPISNVAIISDDIFKLFDKKQAQIVSESTIGSSDVFQKFKNTIYQLLNTEPWELVNLSHDQKIWSDFEDEIQSHSAPDYTNDEIEITFKNENYPWRIQ
ncbi:Phage protein [Lactococcus lactis subsp. lactis]|uniref:Phage protein n=1 Tax=Lactococcus lactis subsp. lactis TaxID=1360 RepID=A0A0V8E761_LACLL|nr:type II toxin-antitoxin system antitoxin SocA domain-containing protein [Lactococcus lactis]KSU21629.1 Phage protein [Lactococcus lactis subsp. lactis]